MLDIDEPVHPYGREGEKLHGGWRAGYGPTWNARTVMLLTPSGWGGV